MLASSLRIEFGRLPRRPWPVIVVVGAALIGCGRERAFGDTTTANVEAAGPVSGDASAAQPDPASNVLGTPNDGETPPVVVGFEPSAAAGIEPVGASCDGDGGCAPLPLADAGLESACPGCFLGGTCAAAGALDPANPCQICDPLRDSRAWSLNDGASCDDGALCTIDDTCGQGACAGVARDCEDGVACNGISACEEASGECSPGVNECDTNTVCDVTSGTCVSTCNGCLINGVCIAEGAAVGGNPCAICDTTLSNTAASPAVGRNCGAAPGACSGQDTCNAEGQCQANHLAPNTPCGNPAAGACNQPDSCDGNGNCLQRLAATGDACDDGSFCTVGDSCQGGACLPGGGRNCGANSTCDEAFDLCRCQGCSIAGNCVAAGALNPANPCQVCDPGRSTVAFSVNENAACGAGQTCNAQGQCVAILRQPLGTRCVSAGDCDSGFCRQWFRDLDGDAHGDPGQGTLLCSTSPAGDELVSQGSGRLLPIMRDAQGQEYAGVGDDCCDSLSPTAGAVFPGVTTPSPVAQTACPAVAPFDHDCSGGEEDQLLFGPEPCTADCTGSVWLGEIPACGTNGAAIICIVRGGNCNMEQRTTLRQCI